MIYEVEQQPIVRIELTDSDDRVLLNASNLLNELIVKMGCISSDEIVFDSENLISITDLIFVNNIIRKFLPWQAFAIEGKLKNE